ncbi:MAG: DUF4440 domain-containing protein [Hyphomonadaceae bacterium]
MTHSLFLKLAAGAVALSMMVQPAAAQNAPAADLALTDEISETQDKDMATDISLARANLTAWLAAFNAKDVDALMALYDPDSSYAGAGGPYLTSLDAIRARYAAGFEAINARLLFQEETAVAGSDMALIVGKFYFAPPAGSEGTGPTGRVALVYRKQGDGTWKLLFDMDNAGIDVSPEDFE